MNREIKFRIFDKNIPTLTEAMKDIQPSGQMLYDMDYLLNSDYFKHALEGNYPIMQYTGLKDKKGKEIFEGDIDINFDVVGWCEKTASFQFFIYDFPNREKISCHCFSCEGNFNFNDGEIEIIGNIYENQELLK